MSVPEDRIRSLLHDEELIDGLAAHEHERWSHWQAYLHGQCRRQADGSLTIPADLVQRWEQQIGLPYSGLSEQEKDSDREQVRRYLPTVVDALLKQAT